MFTHLESVLRAKCLAAIESRRARKLVECFLISDPKAIEKQAKKGNLGGKIA